MYRDDTTATQDAHAHLDAGDPLQRLDPLGYIRSLGVPVAQAAEPAPAPRENFPAVGQYRGVLTPAANLALRHQASAACVGGVWLPQLDFIRDGGGGGGGFRQTTMNKSCCTGKPCGFRFVFVPLFHCDTVPWREKNALLLPLSHFNKHRQGRKGRHRLTFRHPRESR